MKLQSAMEYLGTYGWAILIVVIALASLYELGVFNTGITSTCVPAQGYTCTSPLYSAKSGNVLITIGQNTGKNWGSTAIYFIPQGTATNFSSGIPLTMPIPPTSPPANIISSLTNARTITVLLPVSGGSNSNMPTAVGQSEAGEIWVEYSPAGETQTYIIAEIGTVLLKAA